MKEKRETWIISLSAAVLLSITSCSNMLLDSRISPDSDPIPRDLTAAIEAPVEKGALSGIRVQDIRIIWSEDILSCNESYIFRSNSNISSFSFSGRTMTFSLSALSRGEAGFIIPAGSVSGLSRLTNLREEYGYTYGPDGLTLSISSDSVSPANRSPILLEFLFSENVTDFDVSDITATPGSLGNFSGSGSFFTAEFTPEGDGTAEILVDKGAAVDALLGVTESGAASFSIDYDGTAPSVILAGPVADGGIAGYNTLAFTAVFSEDVTGFTLGDIQTVNAELSGLTGSGDMWSFDVTPVNDALVSLFIPSGVVFDRAGNGNSELSDSFDYTYNSNKIAVNFSSPQVSPGGLTGASTVAVTITFDLDMDENDLENTVSDLGISGGTLSNFTKISDAVYTADIISMNDGTVTLTVKDGAASRSFGRTNTQSSFSFTYDGSDPPVPLWGLVEYGSGDPLASDGYANEILQLNLTNEGDFTADGGTSLTLQYTRDNGATWLAFSNPKYIVAEGVYSGINIRATDGAGNSSSGTALTDITLDLTPPDVPLVSIGTDPVNTSNRDSFSFSLSGGESGADFDYTISSDGGGTEITGNGSLDVNGAVTLAALDVSGLGDGTLSVRARVTDAAGNQSGIGQDTCPKDTVVP